MMLPSRPSLRIKTTRRPKRPALDKLQPHQFWQTLDPPGTHAAPAGGYGDVYPVSLPDGRQLLLPIRVLPGDGRQAVASLIINQASFAVEDALVAAMAALATGYQADIIVGVPTLGLGLAEGVARKLGHPRMVPLGSSRKFWYRDELSEPLSSITTPQATKRVFIDPRMLPLLEGRRAIVVDDVVSSGRSAAAVLRLLAAAQCRPVAVVVAMLQTGRWRTHLGAIDPTWPSLVQGVMSSPLFVLNAGGNWRPA